MVIQPGIGDVGGFGRGAVFERLENFGDAVVREGERKGVRG